MFMQTGDGTNEENVCWLMEQDPDCWKPRYISPFAAKVRWDNWLAKNGCCRTIGPPPKICYSCPEHFLKKHSRQVPVFFSPEELKVQKPIKTNTEVGGPMKVKKRAASLDTGLAGWRIGEKLPPPGCFHPPPSRMGLFRSPHELSYEERNRINRQKLMDCPCDEQILDDLDDEGRCVEALSAEFRKRSKKPRTPPKDYIRANAVKAIRMPARRLKRCYTDKYGVHLLDMSESPYVLRPGFGKVPSYIYRRKLELLEADIEYKQRLRQEGHQDFEEVDDEEREMVIQGLKEYWGELLHEYNSFPLNEDKTERIREAKSVLECKMKEVEADLRLLCSPNTLFVGDDQASHYL